jgi:transcription elongation GreA/GreB family factor
MNDQPPLATPAGRRRLDARLEQALRAYRDVVDSNADAAEAGDTSVWHDNFAYEENQRLMHQLGRRIHDLRALLERVQVVARPSAQQVAVGSRVRVRDVESGVEQEFVVASFDDGLPAERRISYTAPLASALLAARVGEVRSAAIGGREREFEVLSIQAADEEFA